MSAGQRQMRGGMANLQSHFEQSLQELNTMKRGTAGRSANVQELLEGALEGKIPYLEMTPFQKLLMVDQLFQDSSFLFPPEDRAA